MTVELFASRANLLTDLRFALRCLLRPPVALGLAITLDLLGRSFPTTIGGSGLFNRNRVALFPTVGLAGIHQLHRFRVLVLALWRPVVSMLEWMTAATQSNQVLHRVVSAIVITMADHDATTARRPRQATLSALVAVTLKDRLSKASETARAVILGHVRLAFGRLVKDAGSCVDFVSMGFAIAGIPRASHLSFVFGRHSSKYSIGVP